MLNISNLLPNCSCISTRSPIYSTMIHLLQALRAALLRVAEAYDCYLLLICMLTEALRDSLSFSYASLAGYLAGYKYNCKYNCKPKSWELVSPPFQISQIYSFNIENHLHATRNCFRISYLLTQDCGPGNQASASTGWAAQPEVGCVNSGAGALPLVRPKERGGCRQLSSDPLQPHNPRWSLPQDHVSLQFSNNFALKESAKWRLLLFPPKNKQKSKQHRPQQILHKLTSLQRFTQTPSPSVHHLQNVRWTVYNLPYSFIITGLHNNSLQTWHR